MYEKDEWPFDGKVWDLGRKYSWFAVYHLNGDDFVIEGYHPELLDKITENGWKGLTSRESGRIGGIMGKRKRAQQKEKENEKKEDE